MTVSPTDWIHAVEATKVAACSRRQLDRMVARGLVQRLKRGSAYQYSRTDCAAYAAGDIDAGDDVDDADDPTMPKLVAQCHRTIEHLLAPAKLFAELVAEENNSLRARCEQLEARHSELINARESLLDASAERQMLLQVTEKGEERKALVMKQLAQLIPVISAKLGSPAAELLASLDADQLQLLLATDLITESQKNLLRACLPDKPAVAPEKTNGGEQPNVT